MNLSSVIKSSFVIALVMLEQRLNSIPADALGPSNLSEGLICKRVVIARHALKTVVVLVALCWCAVESASRGIRVQCTLFWLVDECLRSQHSGARD